MRRHYYIAILAVMIFTVSFAAAASAQGQDKPASPSPDTAAPAPAQETAQPREIAIYGEVQSVDTAAGSLNIQYYDYDSDSEKTATVIVDKDSKLENAGTLSDIKKGDWADVTYTVKDSSNVARLVTVEKEELPATESATEGVATVPPGE